MTTRISGSDPVLLACMTCGRQQQFELARAHMEELLKKEELRLFCAVCQAVTSWYGIQPDRRSGQERRASRQVRIELPIQVRCDSPDLQFTEVGRTLTASRGGASFVTRHPLREGIELHVQMPYRKGDSEPFERPARVVRAEPRGESFEIGIQFLP